MNPEVFRGALIQELALISDCKIRQNIIYLQIKSLTVLNIYG